MKYHCKHCDFVADGDAKVIQLILDHEKTHPMVEKEITEDGTKPPCSFCGCDIEHKFEHNRGVTPLDLCGIPFKHITYDEVAYEE